MAIVPCPKCYRKVSRRTPRCGHCGAPVRDLIEKHGVPRVPRKRGLGLAATGILLLLAGATLFLAPGLPLHYGQWALPLMIAGGGLYLLSRLLLLRKRP